jgi:hypothetical protein
MSFIKSMSVALATLATAAAVHAQYNAAPPAPTQPISPPESGAVVDHTQPTSPPSGAKPDQAYQRPPQASPGVSGASQQPKTRNEVKGEARSATRDGTIDKVDSEHGLTRESPSPSPQR